MRWLFLFVLSLNLAYYAWEISEPASEDYADVPALKNVETIVLLSELKPEMPADLADKSPSAQRQEVAAIKVVKTVAVEKVASVTDEVSAITGSGVENAETDDQSDIATDSAETADALSPVTKRVESALAGKVSDDAVSVPGEPTSEASCYTLGPFRDLEKLRALTREIKAYVVTADFRGREENDQNLYWVYIKPEKNRRDAIETGHRLKAEKINDFYVIREGEKNNGLSLGHFRNKKRADGLAAKVQKLGFDVTVEPIFKTYTVYWLDYQLIDGVTIPESTFEKYKETDEKGKVSLLSRDCAGG